MKRPVTKKEAAKVNKRKGQIKVPMRRPHPFYKKNVWQMVWVDRVCLNRSSDAKL